MLWIKRVLLILLLGLGAAILIFGPRPGAKAPEGFTVVTYWEKWTGKEADQMQEIVDDFNNTVGKEKKIFVQCLSMSSISQKTLVATAAGSPPDVAGLWDYTVAQYAGQDAIEPLDEMAAAYGIKEGYYKPVYWDACHYNGKLFAMVSTPAAVALHYNKQVFSERADALKAAGLDPARPPESLEELDRYAGAIDLIEDLPRGGRNIKVAGYLPLEPGWFMNVTGYWFGAQVYDAKSQTLRLDAPEMIAAMEWVRSYSQRLGADSMSEFRSGFGGFNSTQNPFLQGTVAMEQQGPWMANLIENQKPEMNRWHVPPEKVAREKAFGQLKQGMSFDAVCGVLGQPQADTTVGSTRTCTWDAGIRTITAVFTNGAATLSMKLLPATQRKQLCQWGAAAFPAVGGMKDVTYAGFDILVIPKGAAHKKEAFEFIAYVNRQDVMEKLCALHCKNSPLTKVSEEFIVYHPNPYIDVFERLAGSPNARAIPSVPIWPEVERELGANTVQGVSLLRTTPQQALAEAQERLGHRYERFLSRQRLRGLMPPTTEATR